MGRCEADDALQKFDPYRFFNLRTSDVSDNIGYKNREQQYQYISVPKENMGFGFGRHACPGRFFASNEIKLILACMLLECESRVHYLTSHMPLLKNYGWHKS